MRTIFSTALAILAAIALTAAQQQEPKPVPKDSIRVTIAGCAKGYVFTTVSPELTQVNTVAVPEGTHIRMNGPKKTISAIDAHKGTLVQITGLMKKDQFDPEGLKVGSFRFRPGPSPTGGVGMGISSGPTMAQIDVEGWDPLTADCPIR